MNNIMLIGFGMPELLVLLGIVILLFGSTKLPQLAKGLGQSIKEFKRGVAEGETETELEEARRRESLHAGTNRMEEENLAARNFTVNKPR